MRLYLYDSEHSCFAIACFTVSGFSRSASLESWLSFCRVSLTVVLDAPSPSM